MSPYVFIISLMSRVLPGRPMAKIYNHAISLRQTSQMCTLRWWLFHGKRNAAKSLHGCENIEKHSLHESRTSGYGINTVLSYALVT